MLALIIIGWIVGGILAWLATGTTLAKLSAPKFWAKANMKYGDGTGGGYYPSERPARIRRSVREQSEVMVIFWPVAFVVLMVSRLLDDSINKHDPAEIERRDKEQKARIAELEKELGINPSQNFSVFDLLTRADFSKLDAASRQAYLDGRRGFTDMFLEDVEDYPHDMLARTVAEMRSARGLPRNYDQDDIDDYTERVHRASKRWLGDV
jgi:hypothetical protein